MAKFAGWFVLCAAIVTSAVRSPAAQSERQRSKESDAVTWQTWWSLNCEPYLNLRSRLYRGSNEVGCWFVPSKPGDPSLNLRPSEKLVRSEVVPRLLDGLRAGSSEVSAACLIALGRIGAAGRSDQQLAEALRASITSRDPGIQECAALALGILGDVRDVPWLEAVVANDVRTLQRGAMPMDGALSQRTRAFAAYGLGLIGYQEHAVERYPVVDALVRQLERESPKHAPDVAVACWTAMGLTALPFDERAFRAASLESVQLDALPPRVLQEQIAWCLRQLDVPRLHALERAQIPIALGRLCLDAPQSSLRGQVAVRLLAFLRANAADASARTACMLALGQLGDCDGDPIDVEIRTTLLEVARSTTDEPEPSLACIALAQVAGRPGDGLVGPLAGLQGEDDARAFLSERLQRSSFSSRPWAALALAVLERSLEDNQVRCSPTSLALLRDELAKAEESNLVGALAIAVGLAGDIEATSLLRETFAVTSEPQARGCVALGLGLLDDRASSEIIADVLRKSRYQPHLFRSAAIGLGLLGDAHIGRDLIYELSVARSPTAQISFCVALGRVGDARAVEPLLDVLRDDQQVPSVRAAAADALGGICDKDVLPWSARLSIGSSFFANPHSLISPITATGVFEPR